MNNKEEYEKFRELARSSKDNLVELGFPQFTVEDFHDTVSIFFSIESEGIHLIQFGQYRLKLNRI